MGGCKCHQLISEKFDQKYDSDHLFIIVWMWIFRIKVGVVSDDYVNY